MRDDPGARLRSYLRVAYDGGTEPEVSTREPRRWAAPTGAAARVAAVLIVLLVAGVTCLVLMRIPVAPAAPAAPTAEPAPPASAPTAAATPSDGEQAGGEVLVVHVAGAVTEPGVVEVPHGTRVADAIERAGGATAEADLDALNLAAPVADGQQVYVPREGEEVPPVSSGAGSATADTVLNLNTADAAALETLPGIGPAIAGRIMAWREEHGAFVSVDALTNVSGIGPATLERLRDLVTV